MKKETKKVDFNKNSKMETANEPSYSAVASKDFTKKTDMEVANESSFNPLPTTKFMKKNDLEFADKLAKPSDQKTDLSLSGIEPGE
jgi:hypothetical protein